MISRWMLWWWEGRNRSSTTGIMVANPSLFHAMSSSGYCLGKLEVGLEVESACVPSTLIQKHQPGIDKNLVFTEPSVESVVSPRANVNNYCRATKSTYLSIVSNYSVTRDLIIHKEWYNFIYSIQSFNLKHKWLRVTREVTVKWKIVWCPSDVRWSQLNEGVEIRFWNN